MENLSGGFFGAQLATYDNGYKAVIKTADTKDSRYPKRRSFRGIPLNTVANREVAFYELSKILGWDHLVPETVELNTKTGAFSSAQEFVPSIAFKDIDPKMSDKSNHRWIHYFKAVARKFSIDDWRKLVLLDLIANSRDRHTKGIVVRYPGPKIVAIDNSISFGLTFARYRCLYHQYLFPKLFNFVPYKHHLARFKLADFSPLGRFLRPLEVEHVFRRIEFLLEFPYRIPFKTISQGETGLNDFPSYKEFFKREAYHAEEKPLVISDLDTSRHTPKNAPSFEFRLIG